MKKILLSSAVLLLAAAAKADTYPCLSFQRADGTTVSFGVESLSMTFGDSGKTLVVTSGTESQTLSVADLTRMFFSTESATGISSATAGAADSTVRAYTATGVYIGQFGSMEAMRGKVQPGVYLVKKNGRTLKIAVK